MMEESGYIVGITAHINNETKLEILLGQLRELHADGVDVCLSINSGQYLEELTKWVKYLVYDSDNAIPNQQFYLDNANIVHNTMGSVLWWLGVPEGWVARYRIPFSGIGRPAFRLWWNSITTAYTHHYKWVCHMEYDIVRPTMGWKRYFEGIINELEQSNKSVFYYNDWDNLLSGTVFVITSEFATNPILCNTDWYSSKEEWIRFCGTGVAEHLMSNALNAVYPVEKILTRRLSDDAVSVWGVSDEWDLNVSNQESMITSQKGHHRSGMNVGSGEVVHVMPQRIDGEWVLHLLAHSKTEEVLRDIRVEYDATTVHILDEITLYGGCWYRVTLPPPDGVGVVRLTYSKRIADTVNTYTESYRTNDLERIYNHLMSIKTN